MNLADTTRQLADQLAKIEDSAVATYIRAQVAYIEREGGDLTEYELVRMTPELGSLAIEENRDGVKMKVDIVYKLRKMKADPVDHRGLRHCALNTPACFEKGYCEGHY